MNYIDYDPSEFDEYVEEVHRSHSEALIRKRRDKSTKLLKGDSIQ